MLKMYILDMTTTVVVMADSPEHAGVVANENRREIVNDSEFEVRGTPKVVTAENLHNGWCTDCIPYGGDGDTRIVDLLPDNAEMTGAVRVDCPVKQQFSTEKTNGLPTADQKA